MTPLVCFHSTYDAMFAIGVAYFVDGFVSA